MPRDSRTTGVLRPSSAPAARPGLAIGFEHKYSVTDAESRHRQRREAFASVTGTRLRAVTDCQFALLPYEELARVAANWYEACAQAMVRGNYGPMDELVRQQARVAADQGFALDDVLQLLRHCRRAAIEVERWSEEEFADVDALIDQALRCLAGQVPWDIPEELSYLTGKGRSAPTQPILPGLRQRHPERRSFQRNRLRLPIRVRASFRTGPVEETTHTLNVARGGLYFLSGHPYVAGLRLLVTYPYWQDPDAINREYPARVVRVESQADGRCGVAVQFLVSLERPLA